MATTVPPTDRRPLHGIVLRSFLVTVLRSRGRVVRVARATYRAGRVPRTTAWRMRQRLAERGIPT